MLALIEAKICHILLPWLELPRNEQFAVQSSLNPLLHRLRTTLKLLRYHTFRIKTHNVATMANGIVQSLQ